MNIIKINEHLEIHYRKHAVYFMSITPFKPETDPSRSYQHFKFTKDEFKAFLEHFVTACEFAWADISPKDANSLMSDYWEYYSKEFDNNGYLNVKPYAISIDPPYGSTKELYKFNKPRARSFLHDLIKQVYPEK